MHNLLAGRDVLFFTLDDDVWKWTRKFLHNITLYIDLNTIPWNEPTIIHATIFILEYNTNLVIYNSQAYTSPSLSHTNTVKRNSSRSVDS